MDIRIVSKTDCPFCLMTKRWLAEHGFEYEEQLMDNEEDRLAFYQSLNDLEETLESIEAPQPSGPSPQDKLIEVEAAKVQAQTQQAAADAQVKVARLQLDQQRAAQDADFKQQKLEIDAAKVVTNG